MQMPGTDGVQFLGRAQSGSEHHESVDPRSRECRGKNGYRLPGQRRQRRVYLPLAGETVPATRAEGAVSAALDHYRRRKEVRVCIALPVHPAGPRLGRNFRRRMPWTFPTLVRDWQGCKYNSKLVKFSTWNAGATKRRSGWYRPAAKERRRRAMPGCGILRQMRTFGNWIKANCRQGCR
jgi:hypothetical protein